MGKANSAAHVTVSGNEAAEREAFLAMGRACKRQPRQLYRVRYNDAAPWRRLEELEHTLVRQGADPRDIAAYYEHRRDRVLLRYGVARPRPVAVAMQLDNEAEAAANLTDVDVLTRGDDVSLARAIEASRKEALALHQKILALVAEQDRRRQPFTPTRPAA